QKKKQLALANAYHNLIIQHRAIVEHSEIIGDMVVALDRRNKKLLVIDYAGKKQVENCITLLCIGDTRIVEEKNSEGNTSRVLLELRRKRTGEAWFICVFDEKLDTIHDLSLRMKKVSYWKTRVDMARYGGVESQKS